MNMILTLTNSIKSSNTTNTLWANKLKFHISIPALCPKGHKHKTIAKRFYIVLFFEHFYKKNHLQQINLMIKFKVVTMNVW
jgi:hypothetical protein